MLVDQTVFDWMHPNNGECLRSTSSCRILLQFAFDCFNNSFCSSFWVSECVNAEGVCCVVFMFFHCIILCLNICCLICIEGTKWKQPIENKRDNGANVSIFDPRLPRICAIFVNICVTIALHMDSNTIYAIQYADIFFLKKKFTTILFDKICMEIAINSNVCAMKNGENGLSNSVNLAFKKFSPISIWISHLLCSMNIFHDDEPRFKRTNLIANYEN